MIEKYTCKAGRPYLWSDDKAEIAPHFSLISGKLRHSLSSLAPEFLDKSWRRVGFPFELGASDGSLRSEQKSVKPFDRDWMAVLLEATATSGRQSINIFSDAKGGCLQQVVRMPTSSGRCIMTLTFRIRLLAIISLLMRRGAGRLPRAMKNFSGLGLNLRSWIGCLTSQAVKKYWNAILRSGSGSINALSRLD